MSNFNTKRIIEAVFPQEANNQYTGHPLALWIIVIYVFKSFLAGFIHMFASDGGAQSIASIPLDSYTPEASNAVVTIFGLWGMEQLIIGIIGLVILLRYRSLIPLMWGIYALEYILRGSSRFYTPGLVAEHTPPGVVADTFFIPVSVLLFIFATITSFKQSK